MDGYGNVNLKNEMMWRYKSERDSNNKLYPKPKERINSFADKEKLIELIQNINNVLDMYGQYHLLKEKKDCLICNKRNVYTKKYFLSNWMWEDSIIHYIKVHNIEPSVDFKDFIYNDALDTIQDFVQRKIKTCSTCSKTNKRKSKKSKKRGRGCKSNNNRSKYKDVLLGRVTCKDITSKQNKMVLSRVMESNRDYVRIERNQLLILDALMINGGLVKKYTDPRNKHVKRYSEHAGALDINQRHIDKIIVYGSTNRVVDGDDEIFLPNDSDDIEGFEYIFHTHPPTPKPGGRVDIGILYEHPSIGDILHFIDNYNDGDIIGSLVMTPEGLYNIRKIVNDRKDINIDDSDLHREYSRVLKRVNRIAIEKYGEDFTKDEYYSEIAQDIKLINTPNKVLEKYNVTVDFYPRIKDGSAWVIDTVFLEM